MNRITIKEEDGYWNVYWNGEYYSDHQSIGEAAGEARLLAEAQDLDEATIIF